MLSNQSESLSPTNTSISDGLSFAQAPSMTEAGKMYASPLKWRHEMAKEVKKHNLQPQTDQFEETIWRLGI